MLGSQTLETAIGLALLFTVLSLAATALRETIEAVLQARAVHLERGIRELLRDEEGTQIAKRLFDHPLISNLFRGDYDPATQLKAARGGGWKRLAYRSNLPAYIPARNVALALMDLAAGDTDGQEPLTVARVRAGIATLPNAHLRRALNVALSDAHGDLNRARDNLEHWFDSGMDRVSGWYRKQTQWILFAIGFLFALLLNIDTVGVARALYVNDDMRAVIVAQAQATVERAKTEMPGDAATAIGCAGQRAIDGMSCAQQQLTALPLPIGWGEHRVFKGIPWPSVPGWLITALAVSLGAPFWFDLLNKMMVIRSTVKPHEKSGEEASEDRQAKAAPAVTVALPGGGAAAAP